MPKIDEIMKNVNKQFKEKIMQRGLSEYDYERIPFTSPRLNYMTFGGLPVGKLIEFYGENGGGKTTTSLDIVSHYQQLYPDRAILWADCENTFDAEWAKKLKVNIEDLIIIKPTNQSAEEIFQIILDSIDTGEIGLVVIDSLGVMVSQQAMDKDIADKTYGGISLALTTFSKKAEMLCQRHKCTLIGINQVREDMNSMYGGTTTPGGKAWKHTCSCRFEFRKGKFLDERGAELTRAAESPAGNIIQVSMIKNKTCPPNRRVGFYTINYTKGINYLADLIDLCIKYDYIHKSGAWFTIIDPESGEVIEGNLQGQARVFEYLQEHKDVSDLLEKAVNKHIYE